jgi:seryl-tRNA synthetase
MEINHEHRITAVEERSKSNTHRIEELENQRGNLFELVSAVKALAIREEAVETDVKEIKKDVKTLHNKPAQRWESLTEKVILTIVAAVLGFFLARIGL